MLHQSVNNDCRARLKLCMFCILGDCLWRRTYQRPRSWVRASAHSGAILPTLMGSWARRYCDVLNALQCLGQSHPVLPEASLHEIWERISTPLSAAVHPAVFCFEKPNPACLVVLNISCEPGQVSQAVAGLCPDSGLDRPCLTRQSSDMTERTF